MWKRCSEGLSGVNCEDGEIEKYKLDKAVQSFKNVTYAGYDGWRLPTIDEMRTLVHCSTGMKDTGFYREDGVNSENTGCCNEGSQRPTINQQAFPNTEASVVWSGSKFVQASGLAWRVNFNSGGIVGHPHFGASAVRLVRSGQ